MAGSRDETTTAIGEGLLLARVLVVLAALAAWLPGVIDAAFIWDDDQYVTENRNLESAAGLLRTWTEPRSIPQYYPLTHTTFHLERALFGENPRGFRATNLLLHLGSALLLLSLLRRLGVPGAPIAALLFAVHPLQAESVLWITERKNLLSLFLMLLALKALLDFAGRGGRSRWALAFLLFAAALAAKSVSCVLPAAFLVLRWMQGALGRRDLLASLPFFGLGLLSAWFTAHLEASHVGATGQAFELDLVERLTVAGRASLFYAGKLLWPLDLSFNYERWQLDGSLRGLLWPLAAALPVLLALILTRRLGRKPAAALLLYGGLLAPALGFVAVYPFRYSFVADHFAYHASPAFLALVAATLASFRRPIGAIVAGAIVLALIAASVVRAGAFASPEALWRDTLARNPTSFLAHHNLGDLLRSRGDLEAALEEHRAALVLRPDLGDLHNEVAIDLELLGRHDQALRAFVAARDAAPDDPRFRLNLARALLARGARTAALAELEALDDEARDHAVTRGLRGAILMALDRFEEALPELEAAAAAPSATTIDRLNLSLALERLRGPDTALQRLPADLPDALRGRRAELLLRAGRPVEAFAAADQACDALPTEPSAVSVWVYLLATRKVEPGPAERSRARTLIDGLGAGGGRPTAYLTAARAALAAREGDFAAAARIAGAGGTMDQRGAELLRALAALYARQELFLTW